MSNALPELRWVLWPERFFEVSAGIVVALAMAAAWLEQQSTPAKESAE